MAKEGPTVQTCTGLRVTGLQGGPTRRNTSMDNHNSTFHPLCLALANVPPRFWTLLRTLPYPRPPPQKFKRTFRRDTGTPHSVNTPCVLPRQDLHLEIALRIECPPGLCTTRKFNTQKNKFRTCLESFRWFNLVSARQVTSGKPQQTTGKPPANQWKTKVDQWKPEKNTKTCEKQTMGLWKTKLDHKSGSWKLSARFTGPQKWFPRTKRKQIILSARETHHNAPLTHHRRTASRP